jgi:hypothetical protein
MKAMREIHGPVLQLGDKIIHLDERLAHREGTVIGFGVDPAKWIQVKTTDGRIRLWRRDNLYFLQKGRKA